jgi:hypothetical protein
MLLVSYDAPSGNDAPNGRLSDPHNGRVSDALVEK